jgi:hypothetical protein
MKLHWLPFCREQPAECLFSVAYDAAFFRVRTSEPGNYDREVASPGDYGQARTASLGGVKALGYNVFVP